MPELHQSVEFDCAGIYKIDKFLWSIENFELPIDSIKSPVFYSGTNNRNQWTLELKKNNSSCEQSFYLHNHNYPNEIPVAWLKILNDKQMEYIAVKQVYDNRTGYHKYGFKINRSELSPRAQSNGTLEVLLKIRENAISSDVGLKSCATLGLVDPPLCSLADRLFPFITNEKFSDVTLEIDGVDLKAHKIMLAAQSPVFSTMFDQEMKETNENRVKISDIDAEVGKQMLEFVYTNKQPSKIDELASELLAVAHMYQMEKLQLMCETVLCQKISTNNAVSILVIGNLFGTDKFMEFMFDFFYKNPTVLKSTEFTELNAKNPALAIKVYDKVLTKKFSL